MIKVGIQTFGNTGHSGRGVGVYGEQLVSHIRKLNTVEVVEFSDVSELKEKDLDLVHFLMFDLFRQSLLTDLKVPFVVTVHDVTPLVFSAHYPAGIRGKVNLFFQKKALKKASKIITVSEASKKDIVQYLGVEGKKVDVVYSGVGEQFKKIVDRKFLNEIRDKYQLPERFAFYSGNVNWNKNILNMTEACLRVGIELVIVGKSFEQRENLSHPELKSYRQFLQKYGEDKRVHILGYVSEDDMVGILNLASVSLFVSFYEGFGFPILEAQACEIPVITSNISSMPEIGGLGALYVDPYSVDSIKNAIEKALGADSDEVGELINKGKENVQLFSWEKCAKETVDHYLQILQ